MYENIVSEALVKSGYGLFYYNNEKSTLEEDFFLRTKTKLVPVEVKATTCPTKSLLKLVEKGKYEDIAFGIKLCDRNIGFTNNIYTIPYYCSFLLRRFLKECE